MDNESTVVSDDNTTVSNQGEAVAKEESVSYEAYRKLLGQRKADQDRLKELESRFQNVEESKLESEGKKDELVNSLRSRLEEKEKNLQSVQQKYAMTTLTDQLKSKAIQMGCKPAYADKLIRLMDSNDLKSIQVDDNYRVNMQDLEVVLDKAKKEVPDFFGKVVSIADATPMGEFKVNKPSIEKMSTQDLINAYKKQFGN
jgi:DNA repair exonuclease SbcCD ATPase subunit